MTRRDHEMMRLMVHAQRHNAEEAETLEFRPAGRREGLSPRYVSRLLELAFLPPKLVEAILAGTQPADMTAETMTRGERGLAWAEE